MFRRMLFLVPVAAIAVGGSTACATKKFVRTSGGQVNDKVGRKDLPDEAKAKLDEMMQQIKADPKGAFFEIAGYTDSVGDKTYNEKLGLERAEAVKRYLYESHQIPLHKMNVISYGE